MGLLRQWFSTPGRQAAGWSAVGMIGLALAAGGVLLYGRGGDAPAQASAITATTTTTATPTATPSPPPSPSPSPSAEPSPSPSASPAATAVRAVANVSTAAPETTAVSATTPEPTPAPVVAGGPYCPSITSTSPPNSVIGLLTSGGVAVPAGATVSIAFDGVPGPSAETAAAGGYRVDYGAAGSDCANRVGAGISVIYNSKAYSTGKHVGDNPGGALRFDVAE